MTDYKKMYAILCGAVDDVIDPLEQIPLARDCVEKLKAALMEAEEIFIMTSPDFEADSPETQAKLDAAWDDFVENYAPPEDREAFRAFTARRRQERKRNEEK